MTQPSAAPSNLTSREKAVLAARFADDKKAEEITVLDVVGVCTFTDTFVICTGTTSIQLRAISEGVRMGLAEKADVRPGGVDGVRHANWVVMDYGDFVVHIMSRESRDYYQLENLWGDGRPVEWQDGLPR